MKTIRATRRETIKVADTTKQEGGVEWYRLCGELGRLRRKSMHYEIVYNFNSQHTYYEFWIQETVIEYLWRKINETDFISSIRLGIAYCFNHRP